MINEVLEVRDYLEGSKISDKRIYKICYMIARYFKEQGLSHEEIRDKIFDWAKKNCIYINYNLNGIIYKAFDETDKLRGDKQIKISTEDVETINRKFDRSNTKLVALALLCYAKACADEDGVFTVSLTEIGNWVGIAGTHVTGRYLKELLDYKYLEKVESKKKFSWNATEKYRQSKFRMLVPLANEGEYELDGNDILFLFRKIF